MLLIRFKIKHFNGFSGATRNRLRKTRILNRLRSIKRSNPAMDFVVHRGDDFVTVEFSRATDQTLFAMLWPADMPRWELVNDISGST